MKTIPLRLTRAERQELERRVRRGSGRMSDARVARTILLLAEGETYSRVAELLGCSPTTVGLWKERFSQERLAGLYGRHRGRQAKALSPALKARILEWTRRKPTDGSTHWSTRRLAKALGVHHMMIAR